MNRPTKSPGVLAVLCIAATLASGCRTFQDALLSPGDVAVKRRQRNEQVTRSFETQRSAAEFQSALAAWHRGDTRQCLATLQRVLAGDPQNLDALLLESEIALVEGRQAEALRCAHRAADAHPLDQRARRTVEVLTETAAADPRAATLPPLPQAGEQAVRPASYEIPLPAGPDSPHAPGPAMGITPPTGTIATTFSSPEATSSPTIDPPAPVRKAEAAFAAGQPSAAMAILRQAARHDPLDPQIPISAAVCALRHDDPAAAVELAEAGLTRFPQSPALYRILGTAYYRLGDDRSSQVALRQALSLDNTSALTYFLLGHVLTNLGQPADAATHFRRAADLDPRYAVSR